MLIEVFDIEKDCQLEVKGHIRMLEPEKVLRKQLAREQKNKDGD